MPTDVRTTPLPIFFSLPPCARNGIRYSDAYEVYGMTRTGCCGCPISYKAVADLELIRPYEPNLVKAAWNIFGKSYEYRQKYNAYKAERMERERAERKKQEQEETLGLSLFEMEAAHEQS